MPAASEHARPQNQPQGNGLVAAERAFSCPGESLRRLRGTLIFKTLKYQDARGHCVRLNLAASTASIP